MTKGYREYLKRRMRRKLRKIGLSIKKHKYMTVVISAIVLSLFLVCTALFKIDADANASNIEVIELTPAPIDVETNYAEPNITVVESIEKPEDEYTDELVENYTEIDNTTLYVITDKLNVRSGASTEFEKLGALYIGSTVNAKGYKDGWYVIDFAGTDGYICEDFVTSENPFIQVESTAYWNEYNRPCANTSMPQSNLTLAGKVEWLGKSCYLFRCNEDGTVGDCLGYYEFHDTGYGQESGAGSSNILSGKTVGTIENGTCIDIFMDTESECVNYGRHDVFIMFVE